MPPHFVRLSVLFFLSLSLFLPLLGQKAMKKLTSMEACESLLLLCKHWGLGFCFVISGFIQLENNQVWENPKLEGDSQYFMLSKNGRITVTFNFFLLIINLSKMGNEVELELWLSGSMFS